MEAAEDRQEELVALLDDYGATGFEQTEEKLIAYFREADFIKDEVVQTLEGCEYEISEVEEKNWNEEWERNFEPVIVDHFCAIRAYFHQPVASVRYDIIITPKMSFGTGHHATTYMMIDQMRYMDFTGKTVFDFGTGTGILAILAQKLGAAAITAIDVDEWSIKNAAENLQTNGGGPIDLQLSSNIPLQQFDIILANINRHVILQYVDYLQKALYAGSHLLISGLLVSDEDAVAAAWEARHFTLQKRMERQGWLSLLFVNTSPDEG